ncbi:MAG: hypothetical protein GX345_05805 [Clostridiales bacterium]|nr:hypothetical protein [Clostridiales bacterium]
MKGKLKNTLVFLFILALLVFSLAACKEKVSGRLIVDDKGITRVLVTDEAGENVTDEAGNIFVYDNMDETHRLAPPEYYHEGDKIVTQKFSLTLPKGWSQSSAGASDIVLEHEKTGNTIRLVTLKKDLSEALLDMEDLIELVKKEGAEVEISTENFLGVETRVSSIKTENGRTVFHVFEKNGTAFSFYTIEAKAFSQSQAGFEEVFDRIEFK